MRPAKCGAYWSLLKLSKASYGNNQWSMLTVVRIKPSEINKLELSLFVVVTGSVGGWKGHIALTVIIMAQIPIVRTQKGPLGLVISTNLDSFILPLSLKLAYMIQNALWGFLLAALN